MVTEIIPSNLPDEMLYRLQERQRLPGADRVAAYAAASTAESTRKTYQRCFRKFEAWCQHQCLASMPAEPGTVALYATHMADDGHSVSGIEQALAAIAKAHTFASRPIPTRDPRVMVVMEGIRREVGTAVTKKAPISPRDLARAFESFPTTMIGIRNRAMLTLGFALGCRRQELVNLRYEDLVFYPSEGIRIVKRKEKTDQEKKGRAVAVHYGRRKSTCPVLLVGKWLQLSGVKDGFVFRSVDRLGRVGRGEKPLDDKVVNRIVKEAASAIGMDPKVFGGHSLRSGFITEAERKGKRHIAIMNQTGHRDINTLVGYVREANLFKESATKDLY